MSVFKVVTLITYDCTEELLCDADDMIESIVCTPSPSFLLEGGGGVELPTKFSKRWELDRTSTFRGGLLGKRGVTFFRGGGVGWGWEAAIFTKKVN